MNNKCLIKKLFNHKNINIKYVKIYNLVQIYLFYLFIYLFTVVKKMNKKEKHMHLT